MAPNGVSSASSSSVFVPESLEIPLNSKVNSSVDSQPEVKVEKRSLWQRVKDFAHRLFMRCIFGNVAEETPKNSAEFKKKIMVFGMKAASGDKEAEQQVMKVSLQYEKYVSNLEKDLKKLEARYNVLLESSKDAKELDSNLNRIAEKYEEIENERTGFQERLQQVEARSEKLLEQSKRVKGQLDSVIGKLKEAAPGVESKKVLGTIIAGYKLSESIPEEYRDPAKLKEIFDTFAAIAESNAASA